ncbi:MAG: hypothetical protein KGJ80_22200, partial [Chloroflexota bacterium]|nr:hypothetical protein [Chloroflexota bacterium]
MTCLRSRAGAGQSIAITEVTLVILFCFALPRSFRGAAASPQFAQTREVFWLDRCFHFQRLFETT